MEEHGVVVQTKGGMAVIKAQRSTSCDGCASKKSCHGTASSDTEILIEAEDRLGVSVGDRVTFEVSAGAVLKAGLFLYLFPILSFIAGVVIGQSVLAGMLPAYNPDLVSGVTGLIFLGAAFGGLKGYGWFAERSNSFKPRILRVE